MPPEAGSGGECGVPKVQCTQNFASQLEHLGEEGCAAKWSYGVPNKAGRVPALPLTSDSFTRVNCSNVKSEARMWAWLAQELKAAQVPW